MDPQVKFTEFCPHLSDAELEHLSEADELDNGGEFGGLDVIITRAGFWLLDDNAFDSRMKYYTKLAQNARDACKDD